ncbi:hypothetical protein FVIR_GE00136 [Candidatus Gullanella endobia]|uniref:Uncharacterized protein n=1 Tax=Candidatus Gullanella endobia TaxID=1070130 RepID=A0A143WQC4_9ENTR|nr:hypothetical protein FVIR_GE00136 [Candidatus Gullanella endobia]
MKKDPVRDINKKQEWPRKRITINKTTSMAVH